jgi:UDP-N-acetylmuramoyl-tripeptide--D-alanyl-D-alanine ligase
VSRWTGESVARATGAPVPSRPCAFRAVSTDTRTIRAGDLFVALTGERFDGHEFLGAARAAGADGAVVRVGTPPADGLVLFPVPDTLRALGRLAHARRLEVTGPVVAVTGTNGKTSTKELLARALGTRWQVHATRGNLNNEVGVPLTILGAPDDSDALVVEAGASVPGEIARLREVIAPTVGVVTNVSAGHLQGFGGVEGVLAEKVSLLAGVPLAVVGTEPPTLLERARGAATHALSAGLAEGAEVRPDGWRLDPAGRAELTFRGHEVRLSLAGRHQAENCLLALGVAEALGLDLEAVAATLGKASLPAGRWEVHVTPRGTVIHDAYNANPASLLAALETVESIRAGRPLVLAVGTMLELGEATAREHARVADAMVRLDPALIGAVGEFGPALERHRARLGERLVVASDAEAMGRALGPRLPNQAVVLLKGSRGMRLERALPFLLPTGEAQCSTTS